MMKEQTVKFSMAYTAQDFKDVVADFAAGKFICAPVLRPEARLGC